jgi:adenosylmethionine-8-amino-7-oxononanoate aminotransferase
VYIVDAEGRRYLDASGGAAVSSLGHGRREVIDAINTQLDRLEYAHTAFFTNEPAEALADHLVERAPAGLAHVYFVSGGSEANETALKLARQYFVEIGEPRRRTFIARRQSYHGNTLGVLAVSGHRQRRAPFEDILATNVRHIAACYAYRHRMPGESEGAYGAPTPSLPSSARPLPARRSGRFRRRPATFARSVRSVIAMASCSFSTR